MDEEQNNKIDPSNFFESIQPIDKVANDALKKTNSNFGLIQNQEDLVKSLSTSIEAIQTEVKQITQFLIVQQDQREKDLDRQSDTLAAQEDQQQKQKRSDLLSGKTGEGGIGGDVRKEIDKAIKSAPALQLFGGLAAMLLGNLLPGSGENPLDAFPEIAVSPEAELSLEEEKLDQLKDRIEKEREKKNKNRNVFQRFFFDHIMGENAEYDKLIEEKERPIRNLQKEISENKSVVNQLIKKADKGDKAAIHKLNFLKTGNFPSTSDGMNRDINPVMPKGGSVRIGKTIYVNKTPSEVEQLMELPFFSPLRRIPIGPFGMLPGTGPTLPNPFLLMKDPSLIHLPRGVELKSRFEMNLKDYNPSLYPLNIRAERNRSKELESIIDSKDSKKYLDYQNETKRLMNEADEKRKDKRNEEKNKKRNEKSEGFFSFLLGDKDVKDKKVDKNDKFVELKNDKENSSNLLENKPMYESKVKKSGGFFDFSNDSSIGKPNSITTRKRVNNRFDMDTGKAYINDKEVSIDEYNTFFNLSDKEKIKRYGIEYKDGGVVEGEKGVDKVPAMLTDGEFVLTPEAVDMVGVKGLNALNQIAEMPNSNIFEPKIENNTQELTNNILSSPESTSGVQVLPPITRQLNQPIDGNNPVMRPSAPSQVTTTKIVDTRSPVSFIDLISNHSLSVS